MLERVGEERAARIQTLLATVKRLQQLMCKHPLSTVIDSLMFDDSPSVLV